jgi:hypothetical protein
MAKYPPGTVKLNRSAFNKIRKSDEVKALMQELGDEMAWDAGMGFEATTTSRQFGRRAHTYVTAVTYDARVAEAKDHVLTQALAGMAQ